MATKETEYADRNSYRTLWSTVMKRTFIRIFAELSRPSDLRVNVSLLPFVEVKRSYDVSKAPAPFATALKMRRRFEMQRDGRI